MQTVIVRYEGALAQSVEREIPGATTVELFNEYGVVTIPDGQLETLRALPEVEYIELPKRLYFDLEQGRRVSCLSSTTLPDQNVEGLQGKGVLVGIIDSGIDYSHPVYPRRWNEPDRILLGSIRGAGRACPGRVFNRSRIYSGRL